MSSSLLCGEPLSVEAHKVDVWSADLAKFRGLAARHPQLLSQEERQRASRFLQPEHQSRFTLVRIITRMVLSRYCDTEPSALAFAYGEHGKPALATANSGIEFNLSHSHERLVLAVAKRAVGVDVEYARRPVDHARVAGRFFCQSEVGELRSLPEAQQRLAFFAAWTRKEAFLKAIGTGLSAGLDQVVVSLRPGEAAQIRSLRDNLGESGDWRLETIPMGADYVAAVCAAADDWRMRWREWRGP